MSEFFKAYENDPAVRKRWAANVKKWLAEWIPKIADAKCRIDERYREMTSLALPERTTDRMDHVGKIVGIDPVELDAMNYGDVCDELKVWRDREYMREEIRANVPRSDKPTADTRPPMTLGQEAVYNLLNSLASGKAMMGPEIVRKVHGIEQSTLTSRIIPFLKEHYHVKHKHGAGYYIDKLA